MTCSPFSALDLGYAMPSTRRLRIHAVLLNSPPFSSGGDAATSLDEKLPSLPSPARLLLLLLASPPWTPNAAELPPRPTDGDTDWLPSNPETGGVITNDHKGALADKRERGRVRGVGGTTGRQERRRHRWWQEAWGRAAPPLPLPPLATLVVRCRYARGLLPVAARTRRDVSSCFPSFPVGIGAWWASS